ncbi:MAG: MFS transporter [Candidatus Sumerlaeota bacterium]|nr:MFS transporter [Candidatus Sumerlaeota bacterium]
MSSKSRILSVIASPVFLLFLAVGCLSAAMSINDSTFNNFLSDTFGLSAEQRGFLELPRETPGFLVVLMTGILFALPETRIGVVGASMLGLGYVGLALFGRHYGSMVSMMVLASAGLHLLQPVSGSLALALTDEKSRGARMGQMAMVGTAGALLGSGFVRFFFSDVAPQYRMGFLCAAAVAFVAALVYRSMHVPHMQAPKARLVVRRRFSLYYVLEFFYGARKQIFITFGPWVLIKVYGFPATKIANLLMISASVGLFLKPLAGMAIDRFGERRIMQLDGFVLIFVCLGYGYAKWLGGTPRQQLLIASACYILDDMLFALSSARAVYMSRLAASPQEITSTLAFGSSINHVASMSIPLAAGRVWEMFGYARLFLGAACLAALLSVLSSFVPPKARRLTHEPRPAKELAEAEPIA